ncbi:hypothetical protein LTR36_004713 [Oleoguttula mirabilis]|uniref:Uncharacterized protein n=1 Tax=Oleoguttula mirabilis TaxID=1507867 RepID=A0AAV9JF63_9PEZI|nr:hypothetical protein LTR36_004713 [Oleoguttula mirabilis]
MTGTGYTVATAAELLGAKPPRRREAADIYFARMKAIDKMNRDKSGVKRKPHVKAVRFESTADRDRDREGGEFSGSGEARASSTAHFETDAKIFTESTASGTIPSIRDARKSPVVVEFPARVKELQAEQTLPAKHQQRIAKTAGRIDTSFTTTNPTASGAGLSRNASTSSKRSKRNSQVTEIYFSPVIRSESQASLSDPIEDADADALLTPTQARYDEQSSSEPGQPDQQMRGQSVDSEVQEQQKKIILTPEQVDRLVKALAECPLLHKHVSRQWWDDGPDDGPDDATVTSETTPSLSSGSGSSTTMYSQPNQQFMTEQRSPATTQAILEEEFAQNFPDHPKAKHPAAHAAAAARSTKFGGIALADPRVHGCPIRFITTGYRLGANVLQVGACAFLNIPYGTSVQSNLRIEPPSSVNGTARVMLQVVNQVLDRKTGRKTYLLVAELDVTESFTRAALVELAGAADIALADIQLVTPAEKPRRQSAAADLDWGALADELQASCAITDIVEMAATSFAKLTADTCTMQTLTLMSELERLKTQHQDFLIVRPTGHHDNGVPSGVHIPWVSQHLDALLYDSDPHNIRGEASKAARVLRDRVVSAVAEGCARDKAFDTRLWWGDQMRLLHCVPLIEGIDGKPAAWVAFLSGESGSLLTAFHV